MLVYRPSLRTSQEHPIHGGPTSQTQAIGYIGYYGDTNREDGDKSQVECGEETERGDIQAVRTYTYTAWDTSSVTKADASDQPRLARDTSRPLVFISYG